MSSSAISRALLPAAAWSGVLPKLFLARTSAPRAMSSNATLRALPNAAQWRGVRSLVVLLFDVAVLEEYQRGLSSVAPMLPRAKA